jgi:hypothetical protein
VKRPTPTQWIILGTQRGDKSCNEGPKHGKVGGDEVVTPFQEAERVGEPIVSPSYSLARGSPWGGTLDLFSPVRVAPQISLVEVACGLPCAISECWGGSISGDHRSYAHVLRQRRALVIMVPPRRPRGWGRNGFSASRAGRGAW